MICIWRLGIEIPRGKGKKNGALLKSEWVGQYLSRYFLNKVLFMMDFIFQQALHISDPWFIKLIDFNEEQKN